jgi:ribosomal-protein-alanine N-acetyltransferase
VTPESELSAFKIRAFRPILEDAAAASAILREAKGAANWSESALQAGTFDPTSTFAFFGELAGQPTGFIIGRQVAGEGEVLNLAVMSSARRHGQGQALVEQLLRSFRDHFVTSVFLEVRKSNSVAIAFYEKLGFRLAGRRPGYYRDPIEAALLYRRLLESTG